MRVRFEGVSKHYGRHRALDGIDLDIAAGECLVLLGPSGCGGLHEGHQDQVQPDAGEQTVIQQVVPLNRQGRVFGFAMAFESAAAPVTAFLIAPIAQVWIIPYARSAEGAAQLAPLLGEGTSRGIALVFLVAGIIMIAAALLAFLTAVYRRVSATYATTAAEAAGTADAT